MRFANTSDNTTESSSRVQKSAIKTVRMSPELVKITDESELNLQSAAT